jgi:hypothetical protein
MGLSRGEAVLMLAAIAREAVRSGRFRHNRMDKVAGSYDSVEAVEELLRRRTGVRLRWKDLAISRYHGRGDLLRSRFLES